MSLSIYHFVGFVLAFWIARLCLRSILALRFHFQFGRLGFFSISNIQYHHHRSSEVALWSVKVGKFKIRLQSRPTFSSPTPSITIYVTNIHVQVHSLAALAAAARQQKRNQALSKLNRRFSRVSSSLKKIPWWYSLSIVKQVIKFTSALPAQLLMAGIANHVDLQVDDFQLEIEQKAVVKVQHLNLSSVLFANVSIPSSVPNSAPASPSTENLRHHRLEGDSWLQSSYQRHSLKRAQHLFKEKFFEINVNIGSIALANKTNEILALPTGGKIAVSCHLSAGCVTLKDVDVNTRVDTFKIKLSLLQALMKSLKQGEDVGEHDFDNLYQKQQDNRKKSNLLQLLRSVTFSIDTIMIEAHHAKECHSLLVLQECQFTGVSETCILNVDPYYKLQCMLGSTVYSLQDTQDHLTLMTLPQVRLSTNMAHALILSKTEDVSELKDGSVESNDLKPNQKYMDIILTLREPRLYLDVSKMDLINKLKSNNTKDNTVLKKSNATLFNLPRASLSVTLEHPSIHVESVEKHRAMVSWSSVAFDVSGMYSAHHNRPVSVAPRFSEPTASTTDMATTTARTSGRPSWTNLFRRSWKAKPISDSTRTAAVQWHYKISARAMIGDLCFEDVYDTVKTRPQLSQQKKQYQMDGESNAFLSVGRFECTANVKLNVSFIDKVLSQDVMAVWDPSHHHINVDVTVDKPVLNLWTKTMIEAESQLEFWIKHIFGQLKSTKTRDSPPHDKSRLIGYISVLKTNITVSDVAIVLEGTDKGVKGARLVPTGFLDNAPQKDIDVRLVMSIQHIVLAFSGSRIFTATRVEHQRFSAGSTTSTDEETIAEEDTSHSKQQITFGTFKLSIQHILVERIFNSKDMLGEVGWHHHEDRKAFILWMSRINMRTEMMLEQGQRFVLDPSVVIKKNGIQYTITNHYACLVTIMSTVEMIKRCFPKKQTEPKENRESNLQLRKLQFQINRTDIQVFLPGGNTQVYLRMDSLRTQWNNDVEHLGEVPPTAIRNVALYGTAPRQPDQWDQLLELDNMRFSIEKDVDFTTCMLVKTSQLAMSKLYIRVPYGYELSHFVDGAVTMLKGVKALHARILKGVSFLFFGPNEKKTPSMIPHMRLVCEFFTFQFEDDPFEARLRSIWKTGLLEQANRIAIHDAFEIKAQSLMQNNDRNRKGSDRESDYADEEIDTRVNDAWQGLQEHNSKSWIRHIDAAIQKELSTYETVQESYYRKTLVSGQFDEGKETVRDEKTNYLAQLFSISIVDLPLYPALLDITMKNICLDFRPPDFELDKTREFIFDVGKGQPLDTALSTFIPFHLDWKSGETWAQLRDYPVPFISVPPPTQENGSSWKLSGNYVFADDLGNLDGTRKINIVMIDEKDTTYTMDIARTSTPLKFFSIVNIDVHTSSLSHICWSVPYQPAIQDISRVMDTFTRPPVDPSDKIGFWDKIRLIIHTRVKIQFVGGGDLAIVMKGSRDPYDMSEKGFGLAKVWRNDVVWLLGEKNPQDEFMQIISRDYAFGVPDLNRGGYIAPYIVAADLSKKENPTSQQKPMHKSASASSFNSSTMIKDSENESRFVKIALKLSGGIRMGIGCHLERACIPHCDVCNEENDIPPEERDQHKAKLLEFLPHYKVKMKAPQNVHEKDYDAYKGFRSDFIHFSLSIIKTSQYESEGEKTKITGNSMHLTPGFMDHFVTWFRLFGGAMSYPLRTGSLFPKEDTRTTKKFGRHMSTMKYKVVVNPLTVGYFMKDENVLQEEATTEDLGELVGLKGFVQNFCVDIHQRREIVNIDNYKLDQRRLKANWPVSEAEVQIKNIDLRAVKGTYNGNFDETSSNSEHTSVPTQVDSSYSLEESGDELDMMEGLNDQCNLDSDTLDWIDLDDFIELGVASPHVFPVCQVLPFAFCPCIYYLRQTNRDDVQKYKYLHKTHDCILGTAVNTREMQMTLLRDRSTSIDVQIRKHQAHLHNIQVKRQRNGSDSKTLDELSDTIVEKTRILYEKREQLQKYLKELSKQAMPDVIHNEKSDAYANSTIFGKDSLAQWEELMGHFGVRYIAHNPQILWNNSVRNVLYQAMELRDHRRAISYYMTSRTVKFLRDLIESSHLNHTDSLKPFVLDDNEGGMDNTMTEDLIAKLLSEKETKFYAPNETEDENEQGDTSCVDMSRSDNVNNPKMQLKTIPKNYVMKSSYLVDLLNAQISLQSDCEPNNIVLVANERTQVKGFDIIDETDPDVEMEMVKHRTVVSLDNLQFFVAKKEKFDSVDLLLDNHYGAKESDHWLAWIPPEMLINYVKRSEQFQRIGDRMAATMQYDKYNPLRIKAYSYVYSQVHPFEDRCDSVQLNFPKLKMTADSAHYNALYQVATDLLLYKEPAKKERLARLREIMMAADRANLYEATEKIVSLQNRARQLIHVRDEYRRNIALLDERRVEEYKSIRLTLYDTLEELYLGMEAIKLMQSNQRKDYHEPKTNLKFVFYAEKLIWEMLAKGQTPLSEWSVTNFNFIFVSKEDHSSTNTLEVDILQVKNTSESPVFEDVLGPYYDASKPYDFSRHKMLRCYFVSLAPVGGIPVIQHLETNLHPIRVQMTHSFGKALGHYLFPPEKRQKQVEAPVMAVSTSTAPSNAITDSETDISGSAPTLLHPSSSEKTDKDTIKSCPSVKTFDSLPAMPVANDAQKSNFYGAVLAHDDIEADAPNESTVTLPVALPQKKHKREYLHKLTKLKSADDFSVMKKRASSNRAFILVKIPGARHCLSYQGPKHKNIEDIRDFAFEQPTLEFRNETWSWYELMSNIKKDFMRAALLHNSKALLKEKLLRRHPRESSSSAHNVPFISAPIQSASIHERNVSGFSQDVDNASIATESSLEDADKDMISLHSAHSNDIPEIAQPESVSKKHRIWTKLVKPKKSSSTSTDKPSKPTPDVILHTSSDQHLSINTTHDMHQRNGSATLSPIVPTRSISAATRHLQDDDQLAIKGRYLLGKYYNGPTQWLAPDSKMKGKQPFKK